YLVAPSIHLRAYAEDWLAQVLAWAKHFHMPGLAYWLHEPCAGYRRYDGVDAADPAAQAAGLAAVKQALLAGGVRAAGPWPALRARLDEVRRTGRIPWSWFFEQAEPRRLRVVVSHDLARLLPSELPRKAFERAAWTSVMRASRGFDLYYCPLR